MSRGRTVAVCLVLAGGLGFGAGQFGQLAFGHHDDAPENVALETAAAQPENKWATVHGRIDANTLVRVDVEGAKAFGSDAAGGTTAGPTRPAVGPAPPPARRGAA